MGDVAENVVHRVSIGGSTERFNIRWEEVCYDVKNDGTDENTPSFYTRFQQASGGALERLPKSWKVDMPETKRILFNNCGTVKAGEVLAIMGPSGSGKTTLLNILAGRARKTGLSGTIRCNGSSLKTHIKQLAYVQQDDQFLASLTVRETMIFAAKLKLSVKLSNASKMKRVEQIIDEMDLSKCADTRIGVVGGGISGGERRRMAIGMELLNKSRMVLLDEPTSGLDAASALMVCQTLRDLASKGHTIICTVHQPRAKMLSMFDKIMVLADGQTVYFGPSVPHCLTFFEDSGYPCPQYENPADFVMDLVNSRMDTKALNNTEVKEKKDGVELDILPSKPILTNMDESQVTDDQQLDRRAVVKELVQKYKESQLFQDVMKPDEVECAGLEDEKVTKNKKSFGHKKRQRYCTPWYNQFWVILCRCFLHKAREPISLATQIFNSTVIPLILGSIYWHIGYDILEVNNRIAAVTFVLLMQAFFAFDILLLFPLERTLYLREQASSLYCTSAFYFGRSLAEVPAHVILTFLVGVISYYMLDLPHDSNKFWVFILLLELATLTGASMFMTFGSFAKTMEQSNMLASFFLIIFMLFGGNWVEKEFIPTGWQWIAHLSFIGTSSDAIVHSQLSGLEFTASICSEAIAASNNGTCPITTGDEVLRERRLDGVSVTNNCLILVLMIVVYRILAYFGLRFCFTGKTFKERLKD